MLAQPLTHIRHWIPTLAASMANAAAARRLSLQRFSSQIQGGRGPAALTPTITERMGYFAIGGLQRLPGVRRLDAAGARERAAAVKGGVRRARAPPGGSTTIVT